MSAYGRLQGRMPASARGALRTPPPCKQLPAVMMRVDASIDPYNRGATQCLTA